MSPMDFETAYPNSRKVYVRARAGEIPLAIPMREIQLSGGEPPLSVYEALLPYGR